MGLSERRVNLLMAANACAKVELVNAILMAICTCKRETA